MITNYDTMTWWQFDILNYYWSRKKCKNKSCAWFYKK